MIAAIVQGFKVFGQVAPFRESVRCNRAFITTPAITKGEEYNSDRTV